MALVRVGGGEYVHVIIIIGGAGALGSQSRLH